MIGHGQANGTRHRRIRGVLIAGLALFVAMSLPFGLRAADRFVPGTEDLPLAPLLTPVDGAGIVFDTPQGRIIEAYAKGKTKDAAVLDFYANTLPQLGWSARSRNIYQREGETLRLELYRRAGELTVRFYLSPE